MGEFEPYGFRWRGSSNPSNPSSEPVPRKDDPRRGAWLPGRMDWERVKPPTPETARRAAVLAADWVLNQPDPEAALLELLEAMGILERGEYRMCALCGRSVPVVKFLDEAGDVRVRCAHCREAEKRSKERGLPEAS